MFLRLLPWLGVLLLALPLIEIGATVWLAHLIGWWTLAWYIASAAVGVAILKNWHFTATRTLLGRVRSGELPLGRLFWLVRSLIAALLFIFPGPVSDLLGLVLLLPWPGHRLSFGLGNMGSMGGAAMGGGFDAGRQSAREGVIEGEFQRVDEPLGHLPHDPAHPDADRP